MDNKRNNELELLIEIQKKFLEILKIKIKKTDVKKEILEYIYTLRYYSFLPITEERVIKNIDEINLKEVKEILYTKACNLKLINIIHKNIQVNNEMLLKILDTKIVKLEEIEIKLYLEANMLQIEIYEGEILESKKSMKMPNEIEQFNVKFNKKIRLFN